MRGNLAVAKNAKIRKYKNEIKQLISKSASYERRREILLTNRGINLVNEVAKILSSQTSLTG